MQPSWAFQRVFDANRWPWRACLRWGIPRYQAVIRRAIPHDPSAFTQGLAVAGGRLYESTGLRDHSSLRCIDLETGDIIGKVEVPHEWCEGLAVLDGRIIQLTWTSGRALIYRASDLAQVGSIRYEGEGWGLSASHAELLSSDGSSWLSVRDSEFRVKRRISVRLRGMPVRRLNDLAWVGTRAYANVWYARQIYEIDLATGAVIGVVHCDALFEAVGEPRGEDVLNGIAYDPGRGSFWLTGKRWPLLFEATFERIP